MLKDLHLRILKNYSISFLWNLKFSHLNPVKVSLCLLKKRNLLKWTQIKNYWLRFSISQLKKLIHLHWRIKTLTLNKLSNCSLRRKILIARTYNFLLFNIMLKNWKANLSLDLKNVRISFIKILVLIIHRLYLALRKGLRKWKRKKNSKKFSKN